MPDGRAYEQTDPMYVNFIYNSSYLGLCLCGTKTGTGKCRTTYIKYIKRRHCLSISDTMSSIPKMV